MVKVSRSFGNGAMAFFFFLPKERPLALAMCTILWKVDVHHLAAADPIALTQPR